MNTDRKRMMLLSAIMAGCALLAVSLTLLLLYRSALEEATQDLVVMAQSQAALVEEVALKARRYEPAVRDDYPAYDARRASVALLVNAHKRFAGLGEHGKYLLARREGAQIFFLFLHDNRGIEIPAALPATSERVAPMSRALAGESGVMPALDLEGRQVLAAYEPLLPLGLGLVVERSLAEVRAPFYRTGLLTLGLTLLLVVCGALLFRRVTQPLLERLERHARSLFLEIESRRQSDAELRRQDELLRHISAVASDVIWVVEMQDGVETLVFISQAFETLWQQPRQRALTRPQLWLEAIIPEERQTVLSAWQDFLAEKGAFQQEFVIERPDGSRRHLWAKAHFVQTGAAGVRAVGIALDITPLKQAQRKSEREKEALQRGFEQQKDELQRVINLMSGREIRMAELKKELAELSRKVGKGGGA